MSQPIQAPGPFWDQFLAETNSIWPELVAETSAVIQKLDTCHDLTADDVKKVRQVKSKLDKHLKNYRIAMTQHSQSLTRAAEAYLVAIGYERIESFIAQKRQMEKKEQDQRVSDKHQWFTQTVNQIVAQTQRLQTLAIAPHIPTYVAGLFPDIASGAQKKALEFLNTGAIISVLTHLIHAVDQSITPAMVTLPLHSATMTTIVSVLKSGDIAILGTLAASLQQDQPILVNAQLRAMMTSPEAVLSAAQGVLDDTQIDNSTKVSRLRQILDAYSAPIL